VDISLRFPQDLPRFLYSIFFKPITLRRTLEQVDPSLATTAAFFMPRRVIIPERRALTLLVLFYVLLAPCLLGFGSGAVLAAFGLPVNWLEFSLYLAVGIALSLSFNPVFCIAFLVPFSLAAAVFSSFGLNVTAGIFLSFSLGLAYGLNLKPAKWGFIAAVVYGVVFGFLSGPWIGLAVGAAILAGYFRLL
jgi:hypothetical protein